MQCRLVCLYIPLNTIVTKIAESFHFRHAKHKPWTTLKPLSAKLTCRALKLHGFLQNDLIGNLEWFNCISAAWRVTLSCVCWWLFSQVLIYCDRQGHCIIQCPRWLRIQNSSLAAVPGSLVHLPSVLSTGPCLQSEYTVSWRSAVAVLREYL